MCRKLRNVENLLSNVSSCCPLNSYWNNLHVMLLDTSAKTQVSCWLCLSIAIKLSPFNYYLWIQRNNPCWSKCFVKIQKTICCIFCMKYSSKSMVQKRCMKLMRGYPWLTMLFKWLVSINCRRGATSWAFIRLQGLFFILKSHIVLKFRILMSNPMVKKEIYLW